VGVVALRLNTTGTDNVAVGAYSLDANTTGDANTAVGDNALGANTTADNNTAVGYSSLGANTEGHSNVALGASALLANTTGSQNTSVGFESLKTATTAGNNTALGFKALRLNTSGNANVAVGVAALTANTTAVDNTAVGYNSLAANTTGDRNTALGRNALASNVDGDRSVAVGYDALSTQDPASNVDMYNVGVGYGAGAAVTTGVQNVLIGGLAGDAITTANSSVALGMSALGQTTTGSNNVAVGSQALGDNTTGTKNVCIGYGAGDAITTGSNNTIIGDYAGTAGLADTIVLAAGTTERMRIDSSGNVGIGVSSPNTKLHLDEVPATIVGGNAINGSTMKGIKIETTANGNESVGLWFGTNGVHWSGMSGQRHNADTGWGTDLRFYTHEPAITDLTYARERMRIDASGNVGIGTTAPAAKLQVEELGIDTTTTSTTAVTQVAIDSMVAATFRSARYTIQVTNSTDGTYHLTEMLLIHDGTTPSINEFGTIYTGSAAEAVFTADINSGNVRILATPASTDAMAFKVIRHSITV